MSIFNINFYSKKLWVPTQVNVILPDIPTNIEPKDFYKSGTKYKVLWLLHGSCSDCNSWFLNTNVARYAIERKIIVVSPTVLNSDYSNYTTFADGFNVWDYFTEELMPMIQGWLPASEKKEDNFIAGLSMGGNGALMFALGHPHLFNGVAILSSTARGVEYLRPYTNLTSAEFRKIAQDPIKFPGPNGTGMRLKEINAIAKYPTVGDYLASPENAWDRFAEVVERKELPKMYVSCGTEDTNVYPRFITFREYAKQLGADVTFAEIRGYKHEYRLWEIAIQDALDFFGLEKIMNY